MVPQALTSHASPRVQLVAITAQLAGGVWPMRVTLFIQMVPHKQAASVHEPGRRAPPAEALRQVGRVQAAWPGQGHP